MAGGNEELGEMKQIDNNDGNEILFDKVNSKKCCSINFDNILTF